MSTIVTRTGKGSELTYAEVDANWTNLNTDKLEATSGLNATNLTSGTLPVARMQHGIAIGLSRGAYL